MCDQTDNSAPTNIDRLKTLQKALDFGADFDVAATDVAKLLSSAGSLEPSSQSMAVALSKSSRLHDWITCGKSASLIVHGNKLSGRKRQRSALSLVCAKLVDELGLANVKVRGPEDSKIFTVSWFCGERTQYAPEGAVDNNANIVAMWRSLIAQLLHQVLDRADLDPAGFGYIARIDTLLKVDDSVKESWLDNVRLGSLFIELVYTLPEGSTLFCILDGVSHHEDRKHHADLFKLIQDFLLIKSISGSCRFKLLATTPLGSSQVESWFDYGEPMKTWPRWRLPLTGGITAAEWDASIGKAVIDFREWFKEDERLRKEWKAEVEKMRKESGSTICPVTNSYRNG
jgi:hypothetical protein